MSGQVSRGSAGEYQADERAGVESEQTLGHSLDSGKAGVLQSVGSQRVGRDLVTE